MAFAGLLQGTPEWLEARRSGIGASDAPIILGMSPYMTAHDLFLEKIGKKRPKKGTVAMDRGNDLETAARSYYELKSGKEFPPETMEDEELPYLRCSLDGRCENEILEIKCPGLKNFVSYRQKGIPSHHNIQVQHQLMVSNAEVCIYWVFSGAYGFEYKIYPDFTLIKKIRELECIFWARVVEKEWRTS